MKNKLTRIITLATDGTTEEEKLAWFNLSKVNIDGADYILTHMKNEHIVTGFYKLNKVGSKFKCVRTDMMSKKPYSTLTDNERVSFYPFAEPLALGDAPQLPNINWTRQPVRVFDYDVENNTIITKK